MRKIIDAGFVVKVNKSGDAAPHGSIMLDASDFGHNRDRMILFLNSIPGPDFPGQLLLQALVIGQDMDAYDTPPIISASANHKRVLEDPNELRNFRDDEVGKSWTTLHRWLLFISLIYPFTQGQYQWFLNRVKIS